MSATGGRLEARISVPAGGWDVSINGGGGAVTANIPVGDYFFSEFLVAVADAFDTADPTGGWTVSANIGETGNGLVTINSGGTSSITWTDTEVRDILGFAGNVSGSDEHISSDHALPVWIPGCPKWTPYGDAVFDMMSDLRQTIAPSGGGIKTLVGNTFECLENVRWDMVSNARAIGTDTFGSWQHFWRVTMLGRFAYITPGAPIRFFWDADDIAYTDVQIVARSSSSLTPKIEGWTGFYTVEIPMMTKVA